MESLEAELERARNLDVEDLADAVESIGFECTRCGACCKGYDPDADADSDPGGDASPGAGSDSSADAGGPDHVSDTPDVESDAPEVESDAPGEGSGALPEGSDVPRERSGGPGEGSDGRVQGSDGADDDCHDDGQPHTATVFPDEVRTLQTATDYDWRDVARPMPYGLREGPDGLEGETFEWALRTDGCGDCTFYEESDGRGRCTVHDDRPLICRTYPFSVALGGTSQPMGEAVDREGVVRAHECEGLGRAIDREEALELARALKRRAVRELEEAIAVREAYAPVDPNRGVVVHDSEGQKRPDGSPVERD